MTVTLAISIVIAAELVNTAIEKLCDHITPQKHENIKFVKDTAAAAVFVCSLGALIMGLIIYVPKI